MKGVCVCLVQPMSYHSVCALSQWTIHINRNPCHFYRIYSINNFCTFLSSDKTCTNYCDKKAYLISICIFTKFWKMQRHWKNFDETVHCLLLCASKSLFIMEVKKRLLWASLLKFWAISVLLLVLTIIWLFEAKSYWLGLEYMQRKIITLRVLAAHDFVMYNYIAMCVNVY